MNTVWLVKKGAGFLPADDDSAKVHKKMCIGECAPFKPMRIRDGRSHRRYWALMTLCAANCERIELQPEVFMTIHSKEDVHTAIKLCTGHCDTIFDIDGKPVAMIPKSTNFDEMTQDEWEKYWPKVLDVVEGLILPNVRTPEFRDEITRCMGWSTH